MSDEILRDIRVAAARRLLFLPHAIQQMSRPDRMLTVVEVTVVINCGNLIEDYPEDVRGHSCLLLGQGDGGRPIHVLCAPKSDYVAVITAYIPDSTLWSDNYTRRL